MLSVGEVKEDHPDLKLLDIGIVTTFLLTGLDVYATYEIAVAARTIIGHGPISEYVNFGMFSVIYAT